jgi:hypothetical protein
MADQRVTYHPATESLSCKNVTLLRFQRPLLRTSIFRSLYLLLFPLYFIIMLGLSYDNICMYASVVPLLTILIPSQLLGTLFSVLTSLSSHTLNLLT